MKNNSSFKSKGLILLILSAYTVIGYIILAFAGKIIPMPFAEGAALIYGYLSGEGALNNFIGVIFLLAVSFCIIFIIIFALKPDSVCFFVKIIIAVLAALDCIVHLYVFIMSEGYIWKYIMSAIFDIIIIMAVLTNEEQVKNV